VALTVDPTPTVKSDKWVSARKVVLNLLLAAINTVEPLEVTVGVTLARPLVASSLAKKVAAI
jgi:hypothetical protein